MASFNEIGKRNVLPNWRNYSKTVSVGEFQSPIKQNSIVPLFPLDEYIFAWKENKSIPFASDLVSAAITNGQMTESEVIDAAKFIISHPDDCSNTQILCAQSILPNTKIDSNKNNQEVIGKLSCLKNKEAQYREGIRILKHQNILFPNNPINYCELARYYANLGQLEKAKTMMLIAVQLAPDSRYISRSAARLFSHIEEYDIAHKILVKNPWLQRDPWIIASEIAINTAVGKNSKYIKKGQELIASRKYTPFSCSELASALATLEMNNGNRKRCRHYMNIALQKPNDNSLAQAEWIIHEDNNINVGLSFGDYSYLQNKAEADSWCAYLKEEYLTALSIGVDWIADFPFDPNPIYFTAGIAYTHLKQYDTAIDIINLGLRANPEDAGLLNNLAYCCALSGQVLDAENILDRVSLKTINIPNETKVCLTATRGLVEYRKGNIEVGQFLYYKAINDAQYYGCEQGLLAKALLNYIREEVMFNSNCDKNFLLSLMDDIAISDKEVNQLKKDILAIV